MNQEKLEALLKKKGIGPEGSKSLKQDELREFEGILKLPEVSLTTKATMMTALLTLQPTEIEKAWLDKIISIPRAFLPTELLPFLEPSMDTFFSLIKKIINKEELSVNECRECMKYFFDERIPDYQKAAFLEGERLKRESSIENKIFFESLWNKSKRKVINIPILIDLCDSYDGCSRTKNFSVFVAVLLASAGFSCYVHSIDSVAPKFGVSSHQVLLAGNKNPFSSLESCAADLISPKIAWTYIDQKIFLPELYAMKQMRKDLVKRPFLATFEKLLQPLQSIDGNLIVTGYTHPHYKEELIRQLQAQGECKQALVLKGAEGATQLSLSKNTSYVMDDGNEISEGTVNPEAYGLRNIESKQDKSLTANDSYIEGLAALRGEHHYARENILYQACVILDKFGLMEKQAALKLLIEKLDSQVTLEHWERGLNVKS